MILHEQQDMLFHERAPSSVTSTEYFHVCATCFVCAVSIANSAQLRVKGPVNNSPVQNL